MILSDVSIFFFLLFSGGFFVGFSGSNLDVARKTELIVYETDTNANKTRAVSDVRRKASFDILQMFAKKKAMLFCRFATRLTRLALNCDAGFLLCLSKT